MTPGSHMQLSAPPTFQQVCSKVFFNRLTPQALYGNARTALTSHLPHGFTTDIL